jgi:aspartate/methionine/tyrosine aminotransferase
MMGVTMRSDILHPEASNLSYEIREIVAVANEIASRGQEITWENIGDPVAKGEEVSEWIKTHVQAAAGRDRSYGYSPTKGLLETREFIAARHNQGSAGTLTPENILFFNGLGDAISCFYDQLAPTACVIGPDPAYPSHVAAEAAHADASSLTYRLDPEDGWQIDLADLEEKISNNEGIVGILLINPGNPTGTVFTRDTLETVVGLAQKYDCFLLVDAIYDELRFPAAEETRMVDVMADVPTILMHGLSKVVPWPGARCGWLEFYNIDKAPQLARLQQALVKKKMSEVCSTTLPQAVLPDIFSDKRWGAHVAKRSSRYQKRAELLAKKMADVAGVSLVETTGAYYACVVFDDDVLDSTQELAIENEAVAQVIEPLLADVPLDKRFVYYLLAAEGICVVPLSSGFYSQYHGFRMTLLESDIDIFQDTVERICRAINEYLNS